MHRVAQVHRLPGSLPPRLPHRSLLHSRPLRRQPDDSHLMHKLFYVGIWILAHVRAVHRSGQRAALLRRRGNLDQLTTSHDSPELQSIQRLRGTLLHFQSDRDAIPGSQLCLQPGPLAIRYVRPALRLANLEISARDPTVSNRDAHADHRRQLCGEFRECI